MERTTMEAAEVAQYLGISKDAVYRWSREGILPYKQISERRKLFTKSEIDQWLLKRRR